MNDNNLLRNIYKMTIGQEMLAAPYPCILIYVKLYVIKSHGI